MTASLFSSGFISLPLYDQSSTGSEGNTNGVLEKDDFGMMPGQSVHDYNDIKTFDSGDMGTMGRVSLHVHSCVIN